MNQRSQVLFFFFFWRRHMAWGILVLWPGIELRPPALGMQSLSPWTTREVPTQSILMLQGDYWRRELPSGWHRVALLPTNAVNKRQQRWINWCTDRTKTWGGEGGDKKERAKEWRGKVGVQNEGSGASKKRIQKFFLPLSRFIIRLDILKLEASIEN